MRPGRDRPLAGAAAGLTAVAPRVPRAGPLLAPDQVEVLALDAADPLRPGVTFTACARCPKHPAGCCADHHPVFTLWDLALLWTVDPGLVRDLAGRWRPGLYDGAPALLVHSGEPACPYADPRAGCRLAREQRPAHCNLFICSGPARPRDVQALVDLAGAWRAWARGFGLAMAARWALAGAGPAAAGARWTAAGLLALVAWAAARAGDYRRRCPPPPLPARTRLETTRAAWFRDNLRL